MIRKHNIEDLDDIMEIWLQENTRSHSFIDEKYWKDNYDFVRKEILKSEVYLYEDDITKEIKGFIGINDNYIPGLFVKENCKSKGIGKCLIDHAKKKKEILYLSVYKKNMRALMFYKKEGFEVEEERIDKNTGEKEILMVWNNNGIK